MNEARIKLADAMGWSRVTLKTFGGDKSNVWESPTGMQSADSLPNPFTDANDDYAVLEWISNNGNWDFCGKWSDFKDKLYQNEKGKVWEYKIGDYARAACKVLAIEVLA